MKWCPHPICKCFMLRQLLITKKAALWNFLLACTWILGWLVVMTIEEQSSSSFNNMFQREKKTNHLIAAQVIFCSSIAPFFTDVYAVEAGSGWIVLIDLQ